MYFSNVTNLDELKNEFRKACIKLHPDTSGYDSQQDFVKMYKEFQALAKTLKNSSERKSDKYFQEDKFFDLVRRFEHLDGVTVNFVGGFIWLDNTKREQASDIKALDLDGYNSPRWASKKKMWYFSYEGYKKFGGKNYSFDEIKDRYGNTAFEMEEKKKLNP